MGPARQLACGEELDRAGHGGELRVVILVDPPARSLAEDFDDSEEVQGVELERVSQVGVWR
ncbi:MAG TPA: hypothetical protein VMV07_18310 [Streptosporangiaceae bacterium]|nr:hypothetical protein [Streptosporangiaceae bacterium]